MTFAVTGVSGKTGRAAAETLLMRGAAVRVIVRQPAQAAEWVARGAEAAVADLTDAAALTRALAGAAAAYLLVPPDFAAADQRAHQSRVTQALAAAASEAGLPHIVLLSGFAAHRARNSGPLAGLHEAEQRLGAVPGLRLTALRAGYFHENVLPLLAQVRETGILPSLFPATLPVPMVATRDVGQLAAKLLLEAPSRSAIVEQGSPLTSDAIARAVAALLGRPVRVEALPANTLTPLLTQLGFSEDLARNYVEMVTGICDGTLAFEGGHRRVAAETSIEASLRPLLIG